MKSCNVLGLMSGSSLDGLDIAHCHFHYQIVNGHLKVQEWTMLQAESVPFSDFWKNRLHSLSSDTAFALMDAHAAFGSYMGQLVGDFISRHQLKVDRIDLIASHGHTIFHEPSEGFTTQIGDGQALANAVSCKTITDFRSADIALGGQGAPLAPMADKVLFPGYDFYLNLGGIANISSYLDNEFIAFDICGANQILNALAGERQLTFDDNGQMARSGKPNGPLLAQQLNIEYFEAPFPKSLSNQWVQQQQTLPFLLDKNKVEDKLNTAVELIAQLIGTAVEKVLQKKKNPKSNYQVLATGGGAFNSFLIDRINSFLQPNHAHIVLPDKRTIEFKEAALMALLGMMRMENIPNCLSSVTGASKDAIGGVLSIPS